MALWTPYAQEEPLDLSRNALQAIEISPRPELPPLYGSHSTYPDPRYPYGYYHQPAAVPQILPTISYVAPALAHPTPRISPDSTGNWTLPQPHPSSSTGSGHHISDSESLSGDIEYQIFENQAFEALAERNGGSLVVNNPRMRRAVQRSQSNDAYRQQREKNNLAAKQSRTRRKEREVILASQVKFLKDRMAMLKARLAKGACTRCAGPASEYSGL